MGRVIHGHARAGQNTKTYKVWQMMIDRCENERSTAFENYGGRGIRVCSAWHDFRNFLADMGEKPPRLSIERIDNSRGYEPGNCRWATRTEQNNNSRQNRRFAVDGVERTIAEWARETGISRSTLVARMRFSRLTMAEAVALGAGGTAATRRKRGWAKTLEFRGERLTTCQWAERLGIGANTINERLRLGWNTEKTLTTPVRRKAPPGN